ADAAGALGNHNVAILEHPGQYAADIFLILHKHRIDFAARANAAAQAAGIRPRDGFFSRCVDIEHQQNVDVREDLDEVLIKILGAAVTVRLVDHDQPGLRPACAHGRDSGSHFAGMMTIVVHQHHRASLHGEVALHVEAPSDSLKLAETRADMFVTDALIGGNHNRRGSIERIVAARNAEVHLERALALRPDDFKGGFVLLLPEIDYAEVGLLAETVGQGGT